VRVTSPPKDVRGVRFYKREMGRLVWGEREEAVEPQGAVVGLLRQ